MSYNRLTCDIKIETQKGISIRFLQCISVQVSSSFATLTNTAKIRIPRDARWVIKNSYGYNEYHLMDTDNLEVKSLFEIGDTITIKIGYDFDNKLVFQGFITGFEPKSPFVLFCEDAAWKLKSKKLNFAIQGCRRHKLTDITDKLLEGTGVVLHPDTKTDNIIIGGRINIHDQTAAQFLHEFNKKHGMFSYIKNNKLLIGRSFFSKRSSIMKTSETERYLPPRIDLERDVVKDNLVVHNVDKNKIALKGVSRFPSNKSMLMTVVLDPDKIDSDLIVTEFIDKRKNKDDIQKDAQIVGKDLGELKINHSIYQTRTIHYNSLEKEELLEALTEDFFKIVDTGLSGDLVLFGDHDLQPASTIQIFDKQNPEKNGEFVIRSVDKSWGQNGYRQIIDIPIKFKNFS